MKTLRLNVRYSGFILFCAAVAAFTFQHCDCKGGKPLVEIKEPIKAPHGVAFIDANGVNKNVQKVKVTLIDTLGQVVSSNGIPFKSVQVDGGVMSIGLSSKAQFNVEKPYLFYIKAEADGYITVIKSVVVTEDAPNYVPIYMTNLTNLPPSGLAASVGNFPSVSGGVLQENLVLTTKSSNKVPVLTLALREGTQLLYDGKPVDNQGALNYQLLFGIPGDANANRAFPGGFEVSNAVNADGKPLAEPANPFFFTTGGWFTLEMNVGGSPVNGFSQPVDVEMPIGDTVINPANGKRVQLGDDFPIWSMDDRTGVWRAEGVAKVEAGANGGLAVRFPVLHLSTWNVDYPGIKCTGTIQLNYSNSDFAGPGLYYAAFIQASDGAYLKTHTVDLASGSPLNIVRAPVGTPTYVLIHDNDLPGSPAYGVSNQLICNDGATTNGTLSRIGTAGSCIQIEFRDVATSSFFTVCNNSVWHKNSCADPLFSLANFITGSAPGVVIPLMPLQTQKCIRIWYLNNLGNQISLDFQVDLSNAVPLNVLQSNVQGTINEGLADETNFLFSYTKNNSIVTSCGTYVLQIFIPASIIATGVCPS